MVGSSRRLACGIGLLLLIFVPLVAAYDQGHRDARIDLSIEQSPSVAPSATMGYRVDCAQPRDHEEADLCAQQGMAGAANWQVLFLGLQTVLLLFALGSAVAAAVFSRNSANSSKEQVGVARDTAKRQLRAYLSMGPKAIDKFVAGNTVVLELHPVNHGQTPAKNIRHYFRVEILDHPLPDGYQRPPTNKEVLSAFSVYPRDTPKTWLVGNRLTQGEIDRVAQGAARLHIWGRTEYEDVFGDRHKVRFVASVGGPEFANAQAAYAAGQRENLPKWNWSWEEGHNDGD